MKSFENVRNSVNKVITVVKVRPHQAKMARSWWVFIVSMTRASNFEISFVIRFYHNHVSIQGRSEKQGDAIAKKRPEKRESLCEFVMNES